jgi:hypothetical protein
LEMIRAFDLGFTPKPAKCSRCGRVRRPAAFKVGPRVDGLGPMLPICGPCLFRSPSLLSRLREIALSVLAKLNSGRREW